MNINLHDVEMMNIKLGESRGKTEGRRSLERTPFPTNPTALHCNVFPSLVYMETLNSEKIV